MHIIVIDWTGSRLDGVVLSHRGVILKAAICGCDDAAEFHFRGGQWFSEQDEPVEIRMYSAPTAEESGNEWASCPGECEISCSVVWEGALTRVN